ncbi:unnamed protein product [Amoebophrya sp. A25]|nr:unnamed protein product [Amoebophrya sp. A25]|eukprot:GSA25T00011856001.1
MSDEDESEYGAEGLLGSSSDESDDRKSDVRALTKFLHSFSHSVAAEEHERRADAENIEAARTAINELQSRIANVRAKAVKIEAHELDKVVGGVAGNSEQAAHRHLRLVTFVLKNRELARAARYAQVKMAHLLGARAAALSARLFRASFFWKAMAKKIRQEKIPELLWKRVYSFDKLFAAVGNAVSSSWMSDPEWLLNDVSYVLGRTFLNLPFKQEVEVEEGDVLREVDKAEEVEYVGVGVGKDSTMSGAEVEEGSQRDMSDVQPEDETIFLKEREYSPSQPELSEQTHVKIGDSSSPSPRTGGLSEHEVARKKFNLYRRSAEWLGELVPDFTDVFDFLGAQKMLDAGLKGVLRSFVDSDRQELLKWIRDFLEDTSDVRTAKRKRIEVDTTDTLLELGEKIVAKLIEEAQEQKDVKADVKRPASHKDEDSGTKGPSEMEASTAAPSSTASPKERAERAQGTEQGATSEEAEQGQQGDEQRQRAASPSAKYATATGTTPSSSPIGGSPGVEWLLQVYEEYAKKHGITGGPSGILTLALNLVLDTGLLDIPPARLAKYMASYGSAAFSKISRGRKQTVGIEN